MGTSELVFEDAEIPAANLLGKPGQGFQQMMAGLNAGRIGIGAQACGIGRACLEDSLAYAKERVQFGKPITVNQAIQFKLAGMATELDAAELLLPRAAWLEDNGKDFEKESAMSKYYSSDVAMRAAIECVQIFGGLWLREGIPGGTPHARRENLPDLRRHQRNPARGCVEKTVGAEVRKKGSTFKVGAGLSRPSLLGSALGKLSDRLYSRNI